MKNARRQKIEQLYNAALERNPEDRAAFLRDACGDESLRKEVESLLARQSEAKGPVESPALEAAALDLARGGSKQSPAALAGRTLARYRISEKLGAGGMGVVYKAFDTRLNRTVSLKVLPPDRVADLQRKERFVKEARAASALNHPNIVTIYDIDQAEGVDFIAMEYLAGETLDRQIPQNGMPIDRVLEIGIQIADALAAAHSAGIVHRDLKPTNVMVSDNRQVKILDFGLAKRVEPARSSEATGATASHDLTGAGRAVGTPAYMSPEQLLGREVDSRSDLFSFGIVMYEMLSGRHPFSKSNAVGTADSILHDEPPSLDRLVKDLPPALNHVVRKLLARKPEERAASAMEVLTDLRMIQRDAGLAPARPAPLRGRKITWFVGLLAAILVVIAAVLPWHRLGHADAIVPAGSEILVGRLENKTGDRQLDHVGAVLENQLRQSAHINIANPEDVKETLRLMVRPPDQELDRATALEVAWRRGIALVINGELSQIGSSYLVNLSLVRTGNRPTEPTGSWSRTFRADGKEKILKSLDLGSDWIREMVGEAAQDLAQRDLPSSETTTSSWEALDFFSRAEKLKSQDKSEDALVLLKEAVRIDPEFALAYMRMGDILFGLRRQREGFHYWQQALSALGNGRLSKREEMRIKSLFAFDTGRYTEAEALFRAFSLFYPNDYYPRFYHGLTLKEAGREPEAIEEFLEAQKKAPDAYYMPAHLAMTWMLIGRFDEARKSIDRLKELKQAHWAEYMEGSLRYLQGRNDEAEAIFAGLMKSRDHYWQSRGYALQAALLGEEGKYGQALVVLEKGILFDSAAGLQAEEADKLLAAAYIHARMNRKSASRSASEQAIRLDRSPIRLQLAGTFLARAGFAGEARQMEAELDSDAPIFAVARHRIRGEVYLAEGRKDLALPELERASDLSPPTASREYLGRARNLAGDNEKAWGIYKRMVDSRARLWHYADQNMPGVWADALFEYIKAAWSLDRREGLDQAVRSYLNLRSAADPDSGEVAEARKILNQLTRR